MWNILSEKDFLMCDLRIIKSIQLNGSDVVIPIKQVKHATWTTWGPPEEYMPNIKEAGFYHIAASGSYTAYFTGDKWLSEDKDYKVLDYDFIDFKSNFERANSAINLIRESMKIDPKILQEPMTI